MFRLSDAGGRVSRRAPFLGYGADTRRRGRHPWEAEGWAAVRLQPPGPPPDRARRAPVTQALGALRDPEAPVGSARTLAEALPQAHGSAWSPRPRRKYRQGMGASYRRPKSTRQHRQAPARVAEARAERPALNKSPETAPGRASPGMTSGAP